MSNQTDTLKFTSLLREFETAMFVTHDPAGKIHSRPMSLICPEGSEDVWFITGLQAELVDEVKRDPNVNLSCQNKKCHLAIEGTAELVHDRARIRELWSKPLDLWFPSGPTDPNVVAVRVRPDNAEFWDERGLNGVRFAVRAVKAFATGERIQQDDKEHGHLKLS
jgi:general stress protein 26